MTMEYRNLGNTGLRVSAIGLGGHEYHPDGRLKGFSENLHAAVQPGYTNPEFPSPTRRALVKRALDSGITYFDATIDPEVRALGECLPKNADVLIQCRPQAMCYHYDPANRSLADLPKLQREVERLLSLTNRSKIDVLNFGIESPALADPAYLSHIAANIRHLKSAGLIRFAACDSLKSGEQQYIPLMQSGCFDIVWLNFGPLCPSPASTLFPLAKKLGLAIVVREAFSKGELFRRAGTTDIAAPAIRWILSHEEVSTLILGVRDEPQLQSNLSAAATPLTDADIALLMQVSDVSRPITPCSSPSPGAPGEEENSTSRVSPPNAHPPANLAATPTQPTIPHS